MLVKKITYTDFDGNERTEEFLFNLTKTECSEIQFSEIGGMDKLLQKIAETSDTTRVIPMVKMFVLKAYGEKSADGRRFIKSDEMSEEFSQTMAYDTLMMELLSDAGKCADFFNAIIPEIPEEDRKKAMEIINNR